MHLITLLCGLSELIHISELRTVPGIDGALVGEAEGWPLCQDVLSKGRVVQDEGGEPAPMGPHR